MIDLVICNPAAAHGIYGPLGSGLIAVEQPQWARIIAAYVRDRGYSVAIVDAEAMGYEAATAAEVIAELEPKLICIAVYGHQPSASTQQMWGAGLLAKALREIHLGPVIMVGGHPSALPERTMMEEAVDFVGAGEGPLTIAGLLSGAEIATIPGLLWRDGEAIRINKPAPLIESMSQLNGNAWDLLPMERYRAHNWQCLDDLTKRQPYASIWTSLNCPFKCSFCCISAPFGSNRYQMRDPADVVEEIIALRQIHGVRTFKITDEMFVLNEKHYTAICKSLYAFGLGEELNIWAYARVDTVKPETLDILRRGGIKWLALGIESGSKYVRDGADKKLKNNDIIGTVKQIQDHGINVIGNFIFGLRDDTMDTMQQTQDLAMDCNLDWANFYCAMAYPGSALYDQALREGWTLPPDWRSFSQHNSDSRPLDTEHIGAHDVLAFRDKAFTDFFSNEGYLTRIGLKFGPEARKHVEGMTTYRLKRKLLETA